MFNVHKTSNDLMKKLQDNGYQINNVDHSTNRYGGKSSYFTVIKGKKYWSCRVSDHNSNWKTAMCCVFSKEGVNELFQYITAQ